MPIITDIEEQKRKKDRVNLYVDDEFYAGVTLLTVLSLNLRVGREIDAQKLQEAVFESEKDSAFGKAADYLSRGMKTEKQMLGYLTGKGYSQEVAEAVCGKLKEYRYIDDETYAKTFVEANLSSKGSVRLKRELITKGINKQTAENYSKIDEEISLAAADKLAEKYMRGKAVDLKTLTKLHRYLLSRGYGYDVTCRIIAQYKNSDD